MGDNYVNLKDNRSAEILDLIVAISQIAPHPSPDFINNPHLIASKNRR
jgi:hypothetical protein